MATRRQQPVNELVPGGDKAVLTLANGSKLCSTAPVRGINATGAI